MSFGAAHVAARSGEQRTEARVRRGAARLGAEPRAQRALRVGYATPAELALGEESQRGARARIAAERAAQHHTGSARAASRRFTTSVIASAHIRMQAPRNISVYGV